MVARMSLPLPSGSWTIDPTHSTVEFVVRHLGLSKVRGRFGAFAATLTVGDGLDDTRVEASIELASVDTANADRDAHLRSTDFFRVDDHPTMTFRSTSIAGRGDRYTMTGDLTLNGVTRPMTFDVEFTGTATYPINGSTHAGFNATAELSRREWGIDFNVPMAAGGFVIGDKVKIELELQFAPALVPDAVGS
jgi:polyisoprenoid-binding protein YceI